MKAAAPNALGQASALSAAGQHLGALSLPVIATALPGSTPITLGLITAAAYLPHLIFGLLIGALADRLPPRATMLGANAARGLLLLGLAALAHADLLQAPLLAAGALLLGSKGALHDAALQRWLATYTDRTEANRAVQAGEQVALAAAPGTSGLLIAQLGVTAALCTEALGFLASSVRLLFVPPPPLPAHVRLNARSLLSDAAEGLQFVLRHDVLRRLALTIAFVNLSRAMTMTLLVYHVLRVLDAPPVAMGLILTAGGLGGLLGASFSRRVASRPDGHVMQASLVGLAVSGLLVPLAPAGAAGLLMILLGRAAGTAWAVTYNIRQDALRQRLSPDGMVARVATASRTLLWGSLPVGALLGGVLGSTVGSGPGLWVAATLLFVAPALLGRVNPAGSAVPLPRLVKP